MRLLVTNTREAQAYTIIRCLRPYAEKVVTTIYGENRLAAFTSHAAHSRLVDKYYRVPMPEADWQSGLIQRENTEQEATYLTAMLEICDKEKIDTIFPSHDPQVYILSKNKGKFSERGITIPVPDFDTLLLCLDKQRTIELARKANFPHPKTFQPQTREEIIAVTEQSTPPWVIKPRLTARSKGMEIVTTREELITQTLRLREIYKDPLVQEYIPGGQKQNFYLMAGPDGKVRTAFCPKIIRHAQRLYRNSSAACLFDDEHDILPQVKDFVELLGWRGPLTLQTKVDARDGKPKLMEINPRVGSHLWYRTELGINEPLMAVKIAQGEEPPEFKNYPVGTLLLEPIEDSYNFILAFLDIFAYKYRIGFLRRQPMDPLNAPPSLRGLFKDYKENYFGKFQRKYSPHFAYFFSDVFSNLLWSYASFRYTLKGLKRIGR